MAKESGSICELCGRTVSIITRHHLIPKSQHKRKPVIKRFDKEILMHSIALLCKPCHKHIHTLFSEKELANKFYSIELLSSQEKVQVFVQWIRTRPEGFYAFTRYKKHR